MARSRFRLGRGPPEGGTARIDPREVRVSPAGALVRRGSLPERAETRRLPWLREVGVPGPTGCGSPSE